MLLCLNDGKRKKEILTIFFAPAFASFKFPRELCLVDVTASVKEVKANIIAAISIND